VPVLQQRPDSPSRLPELLGLGEGFFSLIVLGTILRADSKAEGAQGLPFAKLDSTAETIDHLGKGHVAAQSFRTSRNPVFFERSCKDDRRICLQTLA
jgi:hypothetical protein